ncbi:MAG: sigma 54-interacting transcriptional regulator [Clostridium sp.]
MSKSNEIFQGLGKLQEQKKRGISAKELSEFLYLDRANVSRYLNSLYKEGRVEKIEGRPVLYSVILNNESAMTSDNNDIDSRIINIKNSLDFMVGAEESLQVPIQQAKAAILYPPRGLHTLILGETGVGKSMFAELMYEFAKESKVIKNNSPFIRFNCADYADNPQLVLSQIFGVKKGAYTGADCDKDGLLKKAHGGILFLDEVHRLSPQGQEMLFSFIDKGYFRPLGDTDTPVKVEVQIIAATTEEPQSYLLRTFTRRIPMTITLPSLNERSLKERYYLLEQFIKGESSRIGRSIYFNKNALISFLLYDCPNNIGQLRSDIQLACAKAFLNFKANGKDFIVVEPGDIHQRVSKGLIKLGQHRKEIDEILANMGDVLKFSKKDENELLKVINNEDTVTADYFYDIIESKLEDLRRQGMEEEDISQILNIDIERYFKKYIRDLPEQFRKDELSKIVEVEIVDMAEEILTYASKKLNRKYDEKVYFGLALHLQGSLERIRNGNKIYHPKLNLVRAEYSEEFVVAMEVTAKIDKRFNTQVPLDEIGYLTMFLAAKPYELDSRLENRVSVLVIMHGNSTASSMVDVANNLIGQRYVEALDMPLNMKADEMLELAKKRIIKMNSGKGVLLLVDMGSLSNFGEIISQETNIKVKTIDMVTTLLVLEAGRKALNGRELEDIYKSCVEISRYGIEGRNNNLEEKDNLIITACFTGEGSAEKLRKLLSLKLNLGENVEIKSLDIIDRREFLDNLKSLREKYNILAIVGTVTLLTEDILFIPAPDILAGDGIKVLNELISNDSDFRKIEKAMHSQIEGISGRELVIRVKKAIIEIEEMLSIQIPHEVKVGIVIHICFLIDKIINGGCGKPFEKLNEFRNEFSKEFILIKQSLRKIEKSYNINIGDNELAFIVRIISENMKSVQEIKSV